MTDKKPASTHASAANVNDNDLNKIKMKPSALVAQQPVKKAAEKNSGDKKEEPSKATTAKEKPPKPARKIDQRPIGRRSKSTFIMWLIIVVLVFAAAAFGTWQVWLAQDERIQQLSTKSQQQYSGLLTTVNEKNEQLQQQIADQQDQFSLLVQQSSKEQQLQQQRLDAQLAKINTLTGVSRDGWKLEEARHLLRLANQRQLTGSNVSGIVGLLDAADAVLREIDIPELFIIREQIQNDLVALKLVPAVDREGIYLQLNALIKEVKKLPSAPLTSPLEKKPASNVIADEAERASELNSNNSETAQSAPTLWEAIVQRVHYTLNSLDRYVRVTQHDQPIEPVLSSTQQVIVQENLRLLLSQSQVALLREESVIYQQSVERAIELLDQYYVHYPQKASMIMILDTLKAQKIATFLPNIASSLTLLNQYIDTQPSQVSTRYSTTAPVKDKSVSGSDNVEMISDNNVQEAAP
jgi:uroporphyrin-3 C-methyltransferase